jgi:hypothetical protein
MQTIGQQIRARKRLQRQLADQIRLERNGAPIPGEIAELMTKPKTFDDLYQVHVDVRGEAKPVAVGPKFGKDAASMILEAVNAQICLGKLPGWGNARLEPCFNT